MNIYFLSIDYKLKLTRSFSEKVYTSSVTIAEYVDFWDLQKIYNKFDFNRISTLTVAVYTDY